MSPVFDNPPPLDLLILSNGPGELTTWVRPVVKALRQQMGDDRRQTRISLVLSPCPNASGREVEIAQAYPEIDRIQAAQHFFPFLLWGKTAANWDWRDRGVVVFLGGDQVYAVVVGKRLGYRTVVYGEWQTRWHGWIDRFGVMKPELIDRVDQKYADKFTVVGDLMADVGSGEWGMGSGEWEDTEPQNPKVPNSSASASTHSPIHPSTHPPIHPSTHSPIHPSTHPPIHPSTTEPLIALLPGSKPAKLAQGVPLGLAIVQRIHNQRPRTRFVIPVAPTLDLATLARFADPTRNPIARYFGNTGATLGQEQGQFFLEMTDGLRIQLWTAFPAYDLLAQCRFCITTVGANTAELGALAVPMIVLVPMQQPDAMRAWDGIPGLLANLPGVGSVFATLINGWFLRKSRLLAWPNIWAGKPIVPELIGQLQPQPIADLALDWLAHPQKLAEIRKQLRQVRGKSGAVQQFAQLVRSTAYQ